MSMSGKNFSSGGGSYKPQFPGKSENYNDVMQFFVNAGHARLLELIKDFNNLEESQKKECIELTYAFLEREVPNTGEKNKFEWEYDPLIQIAYDLRNGDAEDKIAAFWSRENKIKDPIAEFCVAVGFDRGKKHGLMLGKKEASSKNLTRNLVLGTLIAGTSWLAGSFFGNKKDVTEKAAPKTEQVQKISAPTLEHKI